MISIHTGGFLEEAPLEAPARIGRYRIDAELEPTPLRVLNPDVDPALEAIVNRCMRKAPGARYRSAVELEEALRGFLQQLPRRRPGLASLAGAIVALLAVAAVGTLGSSSTGPTLPPARATAPAAHTPSRATPERPAAPLLVGRYRASDDTWPATVRPDDVLVRYPDADDRAPTVCLLGREIRRTLAWGVERGALVPRAPAGEPYVLAVAPTRALVRPNEGCGMVVVASAARSTPEAVALTGYRPGAAITERFSALVTWDERSGGSWRLVARSAEGTRAESRLTGFRPRQPHVRLFAGGRQLLIDQPSGSSFELRAWQGGALVSLARVPRGEFGAPLALSDDGEQFACQRGRRLVVVSTRTRSIVGSCPGVATNQVAFEPGGRRLAWVEGGRVVVADVGGTRRVELSASPRARWVRFCFLDRGEVLVADSTGATQYRLRRAKQ